MFEAKSKNQPISKTSTIAWVRDKLNKPPLPISPRQSLLHGKQPKQPAYYEAKYYKPLEWSLFQNWHEFDRELKENLIATWHSDSRIDGLSTIGGFNGKHWLCWIDIDLKNFLSSENMDNAIAAWMDRYPVLKEAPYFSTPSGGYRVLLALEKEPLGFGCNNGFTLIPNSNERMGELLTRSGGHSILPPTVGANGKPYQWASWAEYPPVVGSPADVSIYPLAPKRSTNGENCSKNGNYKSTNFRGGTHWEQFLERFNLPDSENIPLEICLATHHRNIIQSGVNEGERDNSGAALARDLVGTANYLSTIGQRFDGDPRLLLEQFCDRCSPPLTDSDASRLWLSAQKDAPHPCLSEDQIKTCIAAYVRKQKKAYVSDSNSNRNGNGKARSVEDDVKALDHSETLGELDRLSDLGLSDSILKLELIDLSKKAGIPANEVFKLYRERTEELELSEGRQELLESAKQELELLLEANKARLRVEDYFEENLTYPIVQLAKWLNVRPEVFFTALLTGISSLHHPLTKMILVRSWDFEVTPNLFGAIVAPSSQKKSPIIKAMITKPMRSLHKRRKEEYERAVEEYEARLEQYEELKRNRDDNAVKRLREEFPDGKPTAPRQKIHYFTNATGEGILHQVTAHPKQGLLYLKDELAGIFKSANQYRQGRGSDEEDILSYYDGTGGTVLRSSGVTADLEGLLLAIFGSIQPKVLLKMLGDGEDSNGNWARFIFVIQPVVASVLEDDSGQYDLSGLLAWLYESIAALPAQEYHIKGEAFKLFKTAYNRFEQMRVDATPGAMAHVWGKNEGRVGKLAINIHIINSVLRGEIPLTEIGVESIKAAIAFTEFYTLQVQAIYSQLSELFDNLSNSPQTEVIPSHLAKVLEVAERKGDWITARDVIHSLSSKQQRTVKADIVRSWFVTLSQMNKGIIDGDGRRLRFKFVSASVSSYVSQSKSSHSNGSVPFVRDVRDVRDFSEFWEVEDELQKSRKPANQANNENKLDENVVTQVVENANQPANSSATANNITEPDFEFAAGDRIIDLENEMEGSFLKIADGFAFYISHDGHMGYTSKENIKKVKLSPENLEKLDEEGIDSDLWRFLS